jgi:hypothetical protein
MTPISDNTTPYHTPAAAMTLTADITIFDIAT